MSYAVKREDGTIDVLTPSGSWNMVAKDYYAIKEAFQNGFLLNQCVIRPSAVIKYLNESNPKLMEAEIEIEKMKLRRKLANQAYDFAKLALPFVMIIIAAAVAFNMIDSGGAASIAQNAADMSSTTAPVMIK